MKAAIPAAQLRADTDPALPIGQEDQSDRVDLGFPLERWIARNPRIRAPLVMVLLFLLFGLGGWLAPLDF